MSSSLERWRRSDRPLIIGHRGASARATENTARAVELARAEGADAVEIDVQLARCGSLVVFHDVSLERIAGVPGVVSGRTLAELRALRLIGGERIATLDEIFEAAADLGVNIEVKSENPATSGPLCRAVAEALADHPRRGDVLFSSFDPAALARLGRAVPEIPRAFLFHQRQSFPLRSGWPARLVANAAHPEHVLVSRASLARWRARNLLVNAWTVNDPRRVRALAELGVDGIFTNDPAEALVALAA